uniref:hypothetical protein n=1 Tax=Escherichia albertii TaxID=208962 RepID=UPI001F44ABCA
EGLFVHGGDLWRLNTPLSCLQPPQQGKTLMDTGILHLAGRSCHDNKSQRVDPLIALSRIIAGKTKCVKDPFSAQIHVKASYGAG